MGKNTVKMLAKDYWTFWNLRLEELEHQMESKWKNNIDHWPYIILNPRLQLKLILPDTKAHIMERHPNSHLPPNSCWDKVNSLLLSFKPKLLQLPAILCVSLHIALHCIGCLVVGFSLPKGPAWKNAGVVAVSYWCCKQQVSLQCYFYRLSRAYCTYTLSFWLSGHH